MYLEDGIPIQPQNKKENTTIFTDVSQNNIIEYQHTENEYNDYNAQLLLPHKLSQFGPSLAVADVNNDGREDVFVGGAAGFSSKLFMQDASGRFKTSLLKDFEFDKLHEDVAAIFFDIDGYEDQDLYAVSGGNTSKKNHLNYQDRIYLNNGKGSFKKSEKSIENFTTSGSVVIPSDFDNNGDIDLFIGGRHIPH